MSRLRFLMKLIRADKTNHTDFLFINRSKLALSQGYIFYCWVQEIAANLIA